MTFVPSDVVSQTEALAPRDCPYCAPEMPCVLHRCPSCGYEYGTCVDPSECPRGGGDDR